MKTIRIICLEEFPLLLHASFPSALISCESYPELSHGVDVLGFQKGVVVAVHQTLAVDYSCIVHQYRNISDLRLKSTAKGGKKGKRC